MTTLTDNERFLPLPDMTEAEMLVFLAITIQMGHCIPDKQSTGQRLTISTQDSTVTLQNMTYTFISFTFCTSQTTRMSLT